MKNILYIVTLIFVILIVTAIDVVVVLAEHSIDLNYFRGVSIIINLYVIFLATEIIENKFITRYFKRVYEDITDKSINIFKNIILVVSSLLIIGTITEFIIDSKYVIVTNLTIFVVIGYLVGVLSRLVIYHFERKIQRHKDIITKKEYGRIANYMTRHGFIMIGDVDTRNIYSINIKFNVKYADNVVSFLQFLISKPEFAHLIGAIFNRMKIEGNNVYIDDKLITNPSELGLFIFREINNNNDSNTKSNINALIDI